jgi:uncharacterized membrane protein YqjE
MSESGGLKKSLKSMVVTLLAIFQTRLELLSNEIEEERLRVARMLLYGSIALFLFGLAVVLLTALIVVVFWDSYPLLVLATFAGLYFVASLLTWNASRRLAGEKSKLFSVSLAVLADDRDQLATLP